MVNNRTCRPLYDLTLVQAFVAESNFEVVNSRAREHMKNLAWSSSELRALVSALRVDRHYKGSKQAQQSEVGELDVDVYLIKFDEDSLAENRSGLEFYIKLAIDPEEPTVAIVSFHLSGSP